LLLTNPLGYNCKLAATLTYFGGNDVLSSSGKFYLTQHQAFTELII